MSTAIDRDWKRLVEETDGCSSGPLKYIASWLVNRNYKCCCGDHDFDYRFGWRYNTSRKQADLWLKECIEASGHKGIAWTVYIGVRAFGWMFYNKGDN